MITIPLLAADQSSRNLLTPNGGLTGYIFPTNEMDMAAMGRFTTWELAIRGPVNVTGDWLLKGRFLKVLEHSYGPQYANPERYPFTPLETATYVRERGGWGKQDAAQPSPNGGEFQTIADQSDGIGGGKMHVITRTVENWVIRHVSDIRLEAPQSVAAGLKVDLALHFHH